MINGPSPAWEARRSASQTRSQAAGGLRRLARATVPPRAEPGPVRPGPGPNVDRHAGRFPGDIRQMHPKRLIDLLLDMFVDEPPDGFIDVQEEFLTGRSVTSWSAA